MPLATIQIGLPRRVLASYLLFSLLTIVCLLVGGVFATHALIESQAVDCTLSQMGRLASAIELEKIQGQGQGVQSLLEEARAKTHSAYLAVISTHGLYTAHTDTNQIGQSAPSRIGKRLIWGSVSGVSYADADGRTINEYKSRLVVEDHPAGDLVMGVAKPGWFELFLELGRYGLVVILGPMLCIGLGALILARMTEPVSGVVDQLSRFARLPHGSEPQPTRLRPQGLSSIGWNRLTDRIELLTQRLEMTQAAGVTTPDTDSDPTGEDTLNSLSDGVAVTSAAGRIEFANHAVGALLGLDHPLEGEEWARALAAIAPKEAESLAKRRSASQVVEELTFDAAGRPVTLRVARTPLRSSSQEGHVWTVRDITQQKLSNASRDQFIDTATHELRTPLANIKAYAESLASCEIGDAELQKEFCNTINAEATRLARFVDDLLSISSIEVGSLGVTRQNTDVRRLCDEAIEKVKPLMASSSLTFRTQISEKLGEAELDKDKVASLLVNLLGNAAKYTPAGGEVTFGVLRDEGALRFEVADTGPGIAEDEQEKVFEKFYRSENPVVNEASGTGLGLPLAREIARLHDGDITLTSNLGEGCVFTVVLPI